MALKINRTTQRVFKGIGIVLLIVLVLAMGKIFIWETDYYRSKTGEERATPDVPIERVVSALNPSEEKPSEKEIASYQVEKDAIRYLDIERLKIHARVQISEVDTNGILAVPNNIYDANWYAGSSYPGQNGYIIISGIHSTKNNKGIFADLDSLEKDDEIVLETGAGDKYTYQVKEINIISDQKDSNNVLAKMQTRLNSKETLSLVTVKNSSTKQEFESLVMLRANPKE